MKHGRSWYSDGSPRDKRAGTGATCGGLRIKLRTLGPQTIYRAEMVGILVSATQANEEDEICLDNASAVGSSEKTLGAEAIDYDIHAQIDRPVREKKADSPVG